MEPANRESAGLSGSVTASDYKAQESRTSSGRGLRLHAGTIIPGLVLRNYSGDPANQCRENLRSLLFEHRINRVSPSCQQVIQVPRQVEREPREPKISHLTQLDVNCLVTASDDHILRLWQYKVGRKKWACLKELAGHNGRITSLVSIKRDSMITSSEDSYCILWFCSDGVWNRLRCQAATSVGVLEKLSDDRFVAMTVTGGILFIKHENGSIRANELVSSGQHEQLLAVLDEDEQGFISSHQSQGYVKFWQRVGDMVAFSKCVVPDNILSSNSGNCPLTASSHSRGVAVVCYPNGSILICRRAQVTDDVGKYAWSVLQIVGHPTALGRAKVLSLEGESFASFGKRGDVIIWRLFEGEWRQGETFRSHETSIVQSLQVTANHFWSIDAKSNMYCSRYSNGRWEQYCRLMSSNDLQGERSQQQLSQASSLTHEEAPRSQRYSLELLSDGQTVASVSDGIVRLWQLAGFETSDSG